ncbi:retinol dehydrogenase 14a isoform X2 [Brienomyrus brachyistius]|uniref:retinol dehydrogenase 14a isoform X2 n=1 Tax=Brienomyrus brachyistius TaxID=42636 RepID=UPI0020B4400A|nr:retinol dehydrogenase 14a isoform X2 [Brienomyrus brachyistius]
MMRGKTVIITGANSGIGRATATELLRMQARVIMACRDWQRAEEAARDMQREAGPDGGQLVEEARVDVLINNAGVYQCPYTKTEDGFEMQFGVNHLGHFLLSVLLLDLLKKSAPSRIIVVSSKLYKGGEINFEDLNSEGRYDRAFAYSRSKLANLLFTVELAKRLEDTGVTVNALTPGIVRTNLGRHVSVPLLARPLLKLASLVFFKSPLEGAQTSVYLACSPDVEGVQGKCFADCREQDLLPKATDEDLAGKLWDISEVMVGLTQ